MYPTDTCRHCHVPIIMSMKWIDAQGYWECHQYKCPGRPVLLGDVSWGWHWHEPITEFERYLDVRTTKGSV